MLRLLRVLLSCSPFSEAALFDSDECLIINIMIIIIIIMPLSFVFRNNAESNLPGNDLQSMAG